MASSKISSLPYQFDSFCRTVLKNEVRNYYKAMKRLSDREVSLSELERSTQEPYTYDFYPSNLWSFSVCEHHVLIEDDHLAEVLRAIQEQNRDIVLLSFFLNLTDEEIGKMLNMVRRTVQYRRVSTLDELRRRMGVNRNGKEN